jgi:hypothetical protein
MVTISGSRNGGEPARKSTNCLDRSMKYPTHLVKGRRRFEERLFDDPACLSLISGSNENSCNGAAPTNESYDDDAIPLAAAFWTRQQPRRRGDVPDAALMPLTANGCFSAIQCVFFGTVGVRFSFAESGRVPACSPNSSRWTRRPRSAFSLMLASTARWASAGTATQAIAFVPKAALQRSPPVSLLCVRLSSGGATSRAMPARCSTQQLSFSRAGSMT